MVQLYKKLLNVFMNLFHKIHIHSQDTEANINIPLQNIW